MPYITQDMRNELGEQGINELITYLQSVPVETRKGMVAYLVMFLGLESFKRNYFGMSTATDAVRSALTEMERKLGQYEVRKELENGEV